MIKYSTILILTFSFFIQAFGSNQQNQVFISSKLKTNIVSDQNDYKVVSIAMKHLSNDIELITDLTLKRSTEIDLKASSLIVAGTIGKSKFISELIKSKKINVDSVTNKWETFQICYVKNAFRQNQNAVVIIGSDARGTAFGIYELSKIIGVSPWSFWADVPVKKQKTLSISTQKIIIGPPKVKYRGIFLNDEDWGLRQWAAQTFEKDKQDIGPKTYAKVFELMLRLKANYLWPAMHECTKSFNHFADNKLVADSFSIVMGSSHCEPLLFNNATEWDKSTMGKWDYFTNKESILNQLDKRVSENYKFENIYTMGLRGTHDSEMEGRLEKKVSMLENTFKDERDILEKHIQKKASDIPQIFVPYKEVMTLYDHGLKVPDDITLVWSDDNFGYIRKHNTPDEKLRKGGSGIYYHISYLGLPHEYLWLCTTPKSLIFEEMRKAYSFGADRVWMVNVGDIKPAEYATNFFLDLAWDPNKFTFENLEEHQKNWYSTIFGNENGIKITNLMNDYNNLAWNRKPELMAWGKMWMGDILEEKYEDTEFSLANYNELNDRILKYELLMTNTNKVLNKVDQNLKNSFFQLVYYPIMASGYYNKVVLYAQKNRQYAREGRASTSLYKDSVVYYRSKIDELTKEYNSLNNGKWKGMMQMNHKETSSISLLPPMKDTKISDNQEIGLYIEEQPLNSYLATNNLPLFDVNFKPSYFVEIYNKSKIASNWQIKCDYPWVKFSEIKGKLIFDQKIFVSIDWNLVSKTNDKNASFSISTESQIFNISINLMRESIPDTLINKDLFVEKNGYVSINAYNYHRKIDRGMYTWKIIDNIGISGKAITLLPTEIDPIIRWSPRSAYLEYDFYTFSEGNVDITTTVLPTFPGNILREGLYAYSIDDFPHKYPDITTSPERSSNWQEAVESNMSKFTFKSYIPTKGKHTLKLYMMNPGMVFDKIVMDFGGLKRSYLGPKETKLR